MRKIFATLIALAMLSVMTPVASAETVNAEYSLAVGTSPGFALIACSGPPEGPICEENGIAPIGGYSATPTGTGYTQVTATIDDDNFDSTLTAICVYTDDHSICGEDEGDVSERGCGSLVMSVPAGTTSTTKVSGFVYTAHVDADTLETCFGSSGSAVVVYSIV